MAQKESHSDKTEKLPLPNLVPAEFAAMGKSGSKNWQKYRRSFSTSSRRRTSSGSNACNWK